MLLLFGETNDIKFVEKQIIGLTPTISRNSFQKQENKQEISDKQRT